MSNNQVIHGVPKWMLSLPKGNYTVDEICAITKQEKSNVYMRLRCLGVKKKKTVRNNYILNEFVWKGAGYYLRKIIERKLSGESINKQKNVSSEKR